MGKSVSPPPTPDYVGAAKEQGQQNLMSAQQSALLSNPNMYTPFGTQTVSYSAPTFDEGRYNADQASYNAKVNKDQFYETDYGYGGGSGESDGWGGGGGTYFNDSAYQRALAKAGAAPDRNQYMSGGGVPTVTQTLTPEAQATLDAQMRVQRAMAGLSETGIGNARQMLSTPFTPSLPDLQMNVANAGNVQSGLSADQYGLARANTQAGSYGLADATTRPDTYGLAQANVQGNTYGQAGSTAADKYGMAQANVQGNSYGLAQSNTAADKYGLARGQAPLQYSLNTSNLAAMPINAGTNAQNLILQRLQPTIEQGDTSFAQTLANQGLAPGTQAYNAAFRNREMSKNDLYNQAALQGINLDMSARQQGLNEQNMLGTFANQAQLAGAGLYNQAVAQNFAQSSAADQARNQAIAQNFGQGITANELYNRTIGQNFAQGTAADQARNQAIAQNFGQGVAANELYNRAAGQNFAQGSAYDQARNQAIAQNFGQGVTSDQLYNQSVNQNFNQALNAQQANNAAQQQLYGQNLSNAQFSNQAIQQSLAQQTALRAQPMNEIIGLLGGSQIQLPQFGGYQGTSVAPAPTFAATQAANQAAMQNYGVQQAGANSTIQGLGSAGLAAAMYF